MDIDAMPAGREMDRQIAVKVMGLPDLGIEVGEGTRCPYTGGETRILIGRVWCYDCNEKHYSPYKEYSEEIQWALEVVEKMREEKKILSLLTTPIKRNHAQFMEWPFEDGQELGEIIFDEGGGEGDTVPLAICRAALKTVEITKT